MIGDHEVARSSISIVDVDTNGALQISSGFFCLYAGLSSMRVRVCLWRERECECRQYDRRSLEKNRLLCVCSHRPITLTRARHIPTQPKPKNQCRYKSSNRQQLGQRAHHTNWSSSRRVALRVRRNIGCCVPVVAFIDEARIAIKTLRKFPAIPIANQRNGS